MTGSRSLLCCFPRLGGTEHSAGRAYMSGGEVGNSNQYVDTGLSYMTIRRQGGKEVTGQRQRRLATSLGGHHVMAGQGQGYRGSWC